jgi:hydroxymethylpyrimidine pyrophosphatase-like HAD family hydrolase
MPAAIKLVATDLDGTLVGNADDMPIYSEFAARMRELRAAQGTLWVVLSGRPRRSFLEHSESLRDVGILPDYAILKYMFIYRREGDAYRLCRRWSLYVLGLRFLRPWLTRRVLREWRDAAVTGFRGTRIMANSSNHLQLRFKSDESAASALSVLNTRLDGLDHVQTAINGATIDVRSFLSLKGLGLKELERRLGVAPAEVLAIGNGYHDLSMLDERTARLTGCPANSHARVIERVRQAGGHVARQRALAGVLEILNAYMTDSVDSSVPPSWRPPGGLRQGNRTPEAQRAQQRKVILRWAALAVASYAILLAFASVEVVPYYWVIMRPFEIGVNLVARVVSWF